MKKITLIVFFILMLIPTLASAHTALSSSNPEEGEVVNGSLYEVNVVFETDIEEISTLKLIKEDQEISFQDLKVESKQMTGILEEPLANGTYSIQWTIVGEDGHPISGEIPFLVKGSEQAAEQDQNTKEDTAEEEVEGESATEKSSAEKQNKEIEESSSPFVLILIVAFTVILGVSIGLIYKKKR